MHLSVAAADKRANLSFSHTKPQRFFVIFCVVESRRSGFAEYFLGFLGNATVGQLEYSALFLNGILHLFSVYICSIDALPRAETKKCIVLQSWTTIGIPTTVITARY